MPIKKNQSKSHSNSPKRQESVIEKNKKDITEYLIKGEIQYPDLLSDEISKVDETLLKASKRDGQVGGNSFQIGNPLDTGLPMTYSYEL